MKKEKQERVVASSFLAQKSKKASVLLSLSLSLSLSSSLFPKPVGKHDVKGVEATGARRRERADSSIGGAHEAAPSSAGRGEGPASSATSVAVVARDDRRAPAAVAGAVDRGRSAATVAVVAAASRGLDRRQRSPGDVLGRDDGSEVIDGVSDRICRRRHRWVRRNRRRGGRVGRRGAGEGEVPGEEGQGGDGPGRGEALERPGACSGAAVESGPALMLPQRGGRGRGHHLFLFRASFFLLSIRNLSSVFSRGDWSVWRIAIAGKRKSCESGID